MAIQGYITKAQADAAEKVDVLALVQPLEGKYDNIQAPYFVLAAKQQLDDTYGATTVARGGWNVTTTLDMNDQTEAQNLIAQNLPNVDHTGGNDEATVAENVPTGQVVALVGGPDFNNPQYGQNNYAAGILIPPGSSFKPYDYTTLINDNNNVGAGSVLYDSQGPLPGYPCTDTAQPLKGGNCLEDYDFLQPGPLTLRYALGGSRNIPAVKAMLESVPGATDPNTTNITSGDIKSVNKVISTANAMIDNTYDQQHHLSAYNCYANAAQTVTTQCGPSSAIGDGAYLTLADHANGLATDARLGLAIPQTFILKITDAAGKAVYNWTQPKGTQVVRQDAAYIVDNMASDPRASYLPGSCTATSCTGGSAQKFQRFNGWNFAVKTGTTNNSFDGLMTSWSTQYAVVSWVGSYTRNIALVTPGFEYQTEPLTRGMMEYLHQGQKPNNWVQPSDIKVLPSFVVRNHVHYGDAEPSPTDDIYPSWYVGGNTSGKSTAQTIDKVSDQIATSCTPADARELVTNGNASSWNIDIWKGGTPNIGTAIKPTGTNTAATDDVHNCNDSPPTVTLTAPATCNGSCTITATVTQGTHSLSDPQYPQFPGTVIITLNGTQIYSSDVSNSPSTVSFTYTPTSSGSGTLKAVVTDSVLYQGTASSAMNFSAASAITASVASTNSNPNATISWTGGNGTFSVTDNGGATSCTSSGCQISLSHGPNAIVVQDSDGDTSNTVNVTYSGP